MTPKGSQRCRHGSQIAQNRGWHSSRVLFRHEPFGGVAWGPRSHAQPPANRWQASNLHEPLSIAPMPTVQILPDDVRVQVKSGTSLLAAAAAGDVELMHSCGGIGACTSCRVLILRGGDQLFPIGRAEREQLKESGILETH